MRILSPTVPFSIDLSELLDPGGQRGGQPHIILESGANVFMILDFIAQQDYTLLERSSWLARCGHSVALSCSSFVHRMGASVPPPPQQALGEAG